MVRHIRRLPLGPAATRTSISSSARTGPSGAAASRVRAWSEMGTQFTIRTSACFRVANRSWTSSCINQRSPFSSAAARSRAADITRTASRSRSIEPSRQLAPSTSSVSEEEVAHFDALASTWWDADRNTLIGMNPTRVSYIVQTLQTAGGRSTSHPPPTRPLHGLRALDVGCGGGLLSESLARLGADVTAVDPSIEVANAAREHSQHHPLTRGIDYRGGMSVEDLVRELTVVDADVADANIPAADADAHLFDLVCVLEVVEHATDPQSLLDGACQLLRPGGLLFVSTLNRTAKSYVLAIAGAEHIMRMVPVGTHTWEKFLSPAEVGDLIISSEESKMEVVDTCGMVLKPPFVDMRWTLDRNDTDVNWIGAYRKRNDEEEEHF